MPSLRLRFILYFFKFHLISPTGRTIPQWTTRETMGKYMAVLWMVVANKTERSPLLALLILNIYEIFICSLWISQTNKADRHINSREREREREQPKVNEISVVNRCSGPRSRTRHDRRTVVPTYPRSNIVSLFRPTNTIWISCNKSQMHEGHVYELRAYNISAISSACT